VPSKQMTNAATTASPSIAAIGTDANIDLILTPKGTGNVRFGIHTGAGDAVSNGYIEVKDAAGNVRRLMTRA
jgi:hypothetical protein